MYTWDSSILDRYDQLNEKYWKTSRKYGKLLNLTYENLPNNMEIQSLNWKFDEIYNFILAAILYLDEPTISSISDTIQNYDRNRQTKKEKDNFYIMVLRKIEELKGLSMIYPYRTKRIEKLKKDSTIYNLTLNGLCYYLVN